MVNELKKIIDIASSEHYTWADNCDAWHFLKTEKLSAIREKMPKGTQGKLHYHEKSEQFFFILSGEVTFEIEDTTYTLIQNKGISIKPKEKHKIKNSTDNDLEFIVISSPLAYGDRISLE